jgi:phospholipase/carboxylesterase
MSLNVLTLEPNRPANASVIWLHGLGASQRDFLEALPHIPLPSDCALRYCFPQAPSRPVTINQGHSMPSWYDILSINLERQVDKAQLLASAQEINALLAQQMAAGIAPERLIVMGFSQGGALAIETALRAQHPLAGLAVLSSYLPLPETLEQASHRRFPVLVQHGTQDAVVPPLLGEKAHQAFLKKGFSSQWQTFDMEHSLCWQQLQHLGQWLGQCLKKPAQTMS